MRVGILSDTHNRVERTRLAVQLLIAEGVQALIHCGDLTSCEIVEECSALTCYYVFGNNDFDESELSRSMTLGGGVCLGKGGEFTLAERRIAVTHGDSAREIRRLAALAPDYLLYGHTHVPADEKHESTRYINPGALHRAPTWTVARLDLASDELLYLDVVDHQRS
ncbi:metallophosphoesterase family protein [Singulisphaera sp. Ch08]|uniref:Phosphoesterase n=1 Tax=Singulisphaera sp. Ch08 TaxID=3120278 RepID=A0AAU7CBH7_9BACT